MKYLFILFIFFYSIPSRAQNDTAALTRHIKSGMDSMQACFTSANWDCFINFMHPDLIKLTGGKTKFKELLKDQMSSFDVTSIDTIGTGNVLQLIKQKNQWQCIVEGFLQMTIESRTVTVISSNIGVSDDGGKSWKFIRVSTGKEGTMVKLFPSLSPRLKPAVNKTVTGNVNEALKNYHPVYPAEGNH